jgi:hypothetical protein
LNVKENIIGIIMVSYKKNDYLMNLRKKEEKENRKIIMKEIDVERRELKIEN